MTFPSSASASLSYRLRTFGPPALLGADNDTFLGKHGHHRRRLALLAVLAAAGTRGRSRDPLLLLFWPEVSQTRARHSLDQLLYALRGSIGESVFEGTNPLRLNPAVVVSDVGAFNDALERGDFEAGVDAYLGPFLDGFFLTDAPEFEQWAESERRRLAAMHATALERLAVSAAAQGDHANTVSRWRTLTELDPVSNRYAAGLVGALMNAGDHAAALQHAKRYEAFVAQELGLRSGSGNASLVDDVRARTRVPVPASPTVAPAGASVRSDTLGQPQRVGDAVAPRGPAPPAAGSEQESRAPARSRSRWLAVIASAIRLHRPWR